jgi:hypothetical protein
MKKNERENTLVGAKHCVWQNNNKTQLSDFVNLLILQAFQKTCFPQPQL